MADSANNRIEKFTPDGQFAASIGQGQTFTTRPDLLSTPEGVAVAADGTIFATDQYLRRVQHYGADGTFLGSFGSLGSGDGQFSAPAGIAAGPDSLYVADWSVSSVQRFSPAGAFAGRVGSGGRRRPGPVLPPVLRRRRLPRDPVRRRRRQQPHPAPGRARAPRRAAILPTIRPSDWC